MEKFLLCPFLFGNKLNIVNHQYVDIAVFIPKFLVFIVLDGVNQLIREGFTRDIQHLRLWITIQNKMPDGVHQVRFAKPGIAV